MERFLIGFLRRIAMRFLMRSDRKGVAKLAEGSVFRRSRKQTKTAVQPEEITQDPAVTGRRKLHPDERRGDDILYPTDDFTEDMQPRR